MMSSLFSVFDPTVGGLQLNWLSLVFIFCFVPLSYYLLLGGYGGGVKGLFGFVGAGLKGVAFPNFKGLIILGLGVFVYLMISNVLGLFSFIFTGTAHPMFTLSLGLLYWMSFVLMGWTQSLSKSSAHLVPEGSPLILAPVLVVIEMISHLMRPFTLSIRLAANMMAGHLIVGLLSSVSLYSGFSFFASILMQVILLVLESGVAFIQALVFSILMLLYALEYY